MRLNINVGEWFLGAPKRFKTLDTELLARYCVMNKDHEILVGIHEDFSSTADVVWKDGHMVLDTAAWLILMSLFWKRCKTATVNSLVKCWCVS